MDSRRARKRGRPNTTWRRTAERERERAAENSSEVHITVADRGGWRDSVEALCATWHEDER